MIVNKSEGWKLGRRAAGRVLACAAVLLAACADDPSNPTPRLPGSSAEVEVRSVPKPVMSSLISSPPTNPTCGPTVTYAMWSNPYVPGGSVTVSNDAQNIYVTYSITHADWYLTDSRIAVEKNKASIPMENSTTPAPWSFKLGNDHQPAVKSFTYTVSLSSIGAAAGQTVYVSVMAGVVYPVTGNYEGEWEWRTAWAVPQSATSPLIHSYVVSSCGGSPPPPPPPADTTPTQPPPPPPPPPAPPGNGVITITFDDGWSDAYTIAYPVLKELGLVANAAINAEPIIGHWSSYMTLAQVKTLKAAGWSIQNHSYSHPDLTRVSAAQLDKEIKDNKAWITANGLGDAPVFIIPFHSWGARERTAIQKYHAGARGYTVDQFWPEKFVTTSESFDLTGFEPEYAPFTTAAGRAQTIEYARRAVQEGKFIDIFFHHIQAKDQAAFKQLMTELAQFKANIVTYDDIY